MAKPLICDECEAVSPDKVFFHQDSERIIGCSDCAEFALFGDEQYERLAGNFSFTN